MVARNNILKTAILVASLAFHGSVAAADVAWADGSSESGPTASSVRTVGYSTGNDACVAGSCRAGGSAHHGYRCSCPECRDPSAFERLCTTLKIKKRETLHDHSTWAIDHYRHLHHPKCPPYCHPSWGYYQTCWNRFPEETLWCPECPSDSGAALPLPTPVVTPIGPAVAPPPAPARVMPAPAPKPEPPAAEEPPYEEPPAGESEAGEAEVFLDAGGAADEYASINVAPAAAVENPPFLTPVHREADDDFATPPHPRNRWRMEQ